MVKTKSKKDKSGIYDRILASAIKEFADKGFAGARMDEIATQAKINKAMIYYHIGDKEVLYTAVLNSTFGNMAAVMEKNIIWDKLPAENLHIYIQTVSETIRGNPQIPPIMLRETASGGKDLPVEVIQSLSTILEILAQIIKQGIERNEFHPASSLIIHFMLISPLIFLKQMETLIRHQINRLGPENINSKWPDDICGEIETLIVRAISTKG
ncbi:MAG: TetR/AcrR family transcriptional regulator [Desulfobacteraceae bacterium]|nr:TetR/AcrR family transcriptional regulator [Desulfobacteraceae bacterium]MBC2754231.1 TetR/AcrR family transcriptional regulator [Desulfobacteraceae bacterium]